MENCAFSSYQLCIKKSIKKTHTKHKTLKKKTNVAIKWKQFKADHNGYYFTY